jgi:peptide/nickel transport system substrate-binding protein
MPHLGRAIATALAGSLVATTACSVERSAGAEEDVLRIAGPFEVHSLDPASSDGIFTRLQVAETLVSSDLEGGLVPGLSTGWRASRDHATWTFRLPRGAAFHDGTPVTADAVASSLRAAAADPASPLAEASVEDVSAAGTSVRFDLAASYQALPALLTHYSAAVLAPASYDEDGKVTEVIGTGPYEVSRTELPASVETVRSGHWRGTPPDVERVSFQAVGRAESRALMAQSGQADIVFGLEPAGRQRVAAVEELSMESTLQPRTIMMKVNTDHPALGDPRVRRALSLALDREAMAKAVLGEEELGATQLFPPSLTTWASPDLPPLEHGLDAARDLLAEAGWVAGDDGSLRKDGQPLELTLVTYPDRPELPSLATAIQAELAEVGVRVAVDVTNSSEVPARHADGTLDLALFARHFALVSDPLVTVADTFAPEGSDWGVMGWRDRSVTTAVDELLQGLPEKRAQQARDRIARTAHAELPLIPVAWYRMNAAVNERVTGFVLDPLEHTWRLTDLRWSS